MTLQEMKDGEKARILSVEGDRRYVSRITSIGLSAGCIVEMIQNTKTRPLLVYGRDTLIALNRDESKNIIVEAV